MSALAGGDRTDAAAARSNYFLNYAGSPVTFTYTYAAAHGLLNGHAAARGERLAVNGWDLALFEEDKGNIARATR